jgi:ribosomal protein S19E (S16A)
LSLGLRIGGFHFGRAGGIGLDGGDAVAAEKVRVAQPALSRQIMDLEDEIGVDLMKRSPRGIVLTAEGKLFLDEARNIISLRMVL